MTMTDTIEDPMDVMVQELEAVCRMQGVPQASTIGSIWASRILQRLGGRAIYLAGLRKLRQERDERIRDRFDGTNYEEIAKDEGLSERQVRRIVHAAG